MSYRIKTLYGVYLLLAIKLILPRFVSNKFSKFRFYINCQICIVYSQ